MKYISIILIIGCISTSFAGQTLYVSSVSLDTVISDPLVSGELYVIEASGSYQYGEDPLPWCADAEYFMYAWSPCEDIWLYVDEDVVGSPGFFDLLVNNQDMDWRGTTDGINYSEHTFSPSHVYRLYWLGTGDSLSFRISESDGTDNAGSLTVEIKTITSEVSNVTAIQRSDDSKLVDIYYNLEVSNSSLCTVTVEVSDDGGSSWNVNASSFTGDIGPGIMPGNNKHIIWDCKADLPNESGTDYKIKVIAINEN